MLDKILPKRVRQSYQAKIYLTIFVVVVLTASFGAYIYLDVSTELQNEVESDLQGSAETQSRLVGSILDRSVGRLESLSRSIAVNRDAYSQISPQMSGILRQSDSVVEVYYVNATTGSVLLNEGNGRLSEDGDLLPSVRKDVDRLYSPGTSVSDPFRVRQNGIPLAMVVTDVPDFPQRAFVSVINLEALSESVLQDETRGESFAMNSSGTVVLSKSGILSGRDTLSATLGSGSGFAEFTENGARMVAGYSSVEGYGWTIATTVPVSQAYALRSRVLLRILAIMAVVLVGMAVIAFVNRSAVKSLSELSEKANEVRQGNLTTTIESEREDEIGDLFESLDLMRYSLIESSGSKDD